MEKEVGKKFKKNFVRLREKSYIYLKDYDKKDKKQKAQKKYVIERKLKFENYKNSLKATQLDNKINYLEKNEINIDNLKEIIRNL